MGIKIKTDVRRKIHENDNAKFNRNRIYWVKSADEENFFLNGSTYFKKLVRHEEGLPKECLLRKL